MSALGTILGLGAFVIAAVAIVVVRRLAGFPGVMLATTTTLCAALALGIVIPWQLPLMSGHPLSPGVTNFVADARDVAIVVAGVVLMEFVVMLIRGEYNEDPPELRRCVRGSNAPRP